MCLLSSAGGSVQVFGIPKEMIARLANFHTSPRIYDFEYGKSEGFHTAPLISTDLLDGAGDTIASAVHPTNDPVFLVKGVSQSMALVSAKSQAMVASPVYATASMCLISPFTQSIDNELNGIPDALIFSSRISIPFWFSIALKDLPNCKKVDVKLGDRAQNYSGRK